MLRVEHDCELTVGQYDILFVPGRTRLEKILDACRRSLMASHRNPGALRYLRSHSSIMFEKRRHLRHYRRIIHPFSMFRYWWTLTMIFVVTTMLLAIPFYSVFDMNREVPGRTFFKHILLLLCCADVIVNCFTGYFHEQQRIVVLEQGKIIKRYITEGTFFMDVLGSTPTDLIFLFAWQDMLVTRQVTSLICVLRVFSLGSYIGQIARVHDIPLALYEFCAIIFWLMLALHLQACLYWVVPVMATSMGQPQKPKEDSWMQGTDLWEAGSISQQYYTCLLRAVATFLRSGFLRMYPRNKEDLYVVICLQVMGAFTTWILIARVKKFFKGVNSSKLRYEATIAQLRQYMRYEQLPRPTQRRLLAYYEFRYQQRYFREADILNTLSSQMRQEIGMHSCRKLVENVTFFNNLPITLLARIVALLRSEIFLTNDVIVRANQPGNCMYFIASGTVAIYTSFGKEVCHLEDGAHFGEIALVMPDQWRVASVVAIEICELYRLDRADFARTIHPYPMLWDRIKKIAIERHEKTTILSQQ